MYADAGVAAARGSGAPPLSQLSRSTWSSVSSLLQKSPSTTGPSTATVSTTRRLTGAAAPATYAPAVDSATNGMSVTGADADTTWPTAPGGGCSGAP